MWMWWLMRGGTVAACSLSVCRQVRPDIGPWWLAHVRAGLIPCPVPACPLACADAGALLPAAAARQDHRAAPAHADARRGCGPSGELVAGGPAAAPQLLLACRVSQGALSLWTPATGEPKWDAALT